MIHCPIAVKDAASNPLLGASVSSSYLSWFSSSTPQ